MAFYELTKAQRTQLVVTINNEIVQGLENCSIGQVLAYFKHEDTYQRKAAYLSVGRLFVSYKSLQPRIISLLDKLVKHDNFKVRQTAINTAGEIGKINFHIVQHLFDKGLFDLHHSPRNAVIGSIKKMGEVNPIPVLEWAKKYLYHQDKEIRREICHGIELRGRKYPQEILPFLKELQYDKTARVRNTLVHVIGQISYKHGCLRIVVEHLDKWENKELVAAAFREIVDVHERYKNFSALTQDEAKRYISAHSSPGPALNLYKPHHEKKTRNIMDRHK